MKIEFNITNLLSLILILGFSFYVISVIKKSSKQESETTFRIDALNRSIDSLENVIDIRIEYFNQRNELIDSLLKLTYDEEAINNYWDSIRYNTPDSITDRELREYLRRKKRTLF